MTAHPAYDSESEDPIEILHVLPEEFHAQFRAEYAVAVDAARRPEHFHRLQDMLRLWRLRAAAYSSPGYAGRLADARQGHAGDFIPAMKLIPSWPDNRQSR